MSGPTEVFGALVAEASGWAPTSLPPLPPDRPGPSTLTRAGLPYELSVGVRRTGGRPALRYVLDPAPEVIDTAERLAAEGDALRAWGARTGLDITVAADLAACAFPAGAEVSDAPFLTWLGAVHPQPATGQAAALKLYTCTQAAAGALGRVGERWPEVAAMAALLPDDLAPVLSVAVTVPAAGPPAFAVYRPVRSGYEHQALERLGAALVTDTGRWTSALARRGLAKLLWTGPVVLSTRQRPGDPEPTVGVDLSLERTADPRTLVAQAAAAWGPDGRAALTALEGWATAARRPLRLTWLGVELAAEELVGLSLYAVPVPPRR